MRVVIVGAGGVGGYLGVRLHQAGHEVAYLVRARTLEALQTRGIALRNSLGDAHIPQVRASDDAAALGPADAVIVTVKLYDLPALAPRLAPLAGPETMILPLQNGVDSFDILTGVLPRANVLKGTVTIKSFVESPGVIVCKSPFCKIRFGEADSRPSIRTATLKDVLNSGLGVEAGVSADIDAELWRKFFMLASFSAVSCMARARIGAVLDCEPARTLVVDAALEAAAVGRALGIALPADIEDAVIQQVNLMPRDGRPSMLEDLEAGRRLELPWFSGTVARLGRQFGIATPIHDTAFRVLSIHAQGRTAPGAAS
jgi:2-dehydropantoate 2-reductase